MLKGLLQTAVLAALMALALIIFCPNVHAGVLPVVELDARDVLIAQPDGPMPGCIVDTKQNGRISTLVFPMECNDLVPDLKEYQQAENKQAIIYLTINGQHINLI